MNKYFAKKPNHNGQIEFTDAEHNIWKHLFNKVYAKAFKYGSRMYLDGLKILKVNCYYQIVKLN